MTSLPVGEATANVTKTSAERHSHILETSYRSFTSSWRPDDAHTPVGAARKLWKFITRRHQRGFWESQRKNGINWKRKSEKGRGEEEKGKWEEKARLLWSVARCLCGLYISAFRRQAKQGRGTDTHTHTRRTRPSALFKPQAHFFITSMRIWKQCDSEQGAISISRLLMKQHWCTQQLSKSDANTHSLSPRPRRLAPSHADRTDRACGSAFLFFSSLVLVGFMWAVPIVNLTRPKVTPLLSETDFFLHPL